MALTKEIEWDCDVRGPYKTVRVIKVTVIKEDGNEISRSSNQYTLNCRTKTGETWADTDISGEDASIQAVCSVWTDSIKSAYETYADAQPDL